MDGWMDGNIDQIPPDLFLYICMCTLMTDLYLRLSSSSSSQVSLGTILFHVLSVLEGGSPEIEDLYSLRLWKNMMWYGPIFVTSTQVSQSLSQ